jgi:adenylate cyclase
LRKLLVAVSIGLGAALLALTAGRLPFVKTVELKSYDWRMRATADPSAARDDIVLVDIDEQSIRALAPYFGRWPWPRLVHAHLLDFLARSRPKVVLYDILFGEPDRSKFTIGDDQWTGEQSDNELAGSAKKLGSVIFVGDATEEASGAPTPTPVAQDFSPVHQSPVQQHWIEARPRFNPPMPALRDVSRGTAHNLLVLDADGVARRCIPFVRAGDTTIPALAVAGAIEALGLHASNVRFDADGFWLGDRLVPLAASEAPTLDGGTRVVRRLPIAYRGVWPDQRRTYHTYSFAQLFQSEEQLLAGEKADVDPAAFAGKIRHRRRDGCGPLRPEGRALRAEDVRPGNPRQYRGQYPFRPVHQGGIALDVGAAHAWCGDRRGVGRGARRHVAGRHRCPRAGRRSCSRPEQPVPAAARGCRS